MSLPKRIFGRQFNGRPIRELSSAESLVERLDIAHELVGHTGCVNALDWSADGRYLASGSDDKRVIIWDAHSSSYHKVKDIYTGHTRNIFSVKFIPGTGDSTLISAAGDNQIRVFNVEYGAAAATVLREPTERRVYRNHRDRVKRLEVEHDGHCFLSCSEDGDVRQFDLRENPANAARGPLISYADYQIDLTTMSLNRSNPYLLALGGSYPCAFLHDRRMVGRDMLDEWGKIAAGETPTHCVRRFQPSRTDKDGRRARQITALRFSNANPQELLCSWIKDDIYLFNIHEQEPRASSASSTSSPPRHSFSEPSQKRKRSRSITPPHDGLWLDYPEDCGAKTFVFFTTEYLSSFDFRPADDNEAYDSFMRQSVPALQELPNTNSTASPQDIEDCRMILGALAKDVSILQIPEPIEGTWLSKTIHRITKAYCSGTLVPLEEGGSAHGSHKIRRISLHEEVLFRNYDSLVSCYNAMVATGGTEMTMGDAASRDFWIEGVCRRLLYEIFNGPPSPYTSELGDDIPDISDLPIYVGDDRSDVSDESEFDPYADNTPYADEDPYAFNDAEVFRNLTSGTQIHPEVPLITAKSSFSGHVNVETIKDVNFFGMQDEYVMSGSDDGLLFIWRKSNGQIITMLRADSNVTNVMEANPSCTSLAVSGIDDTVKIFQPFEGEREEEALPSRRVRESEYEIRARNKMRSRHDGMDDNAIPIPRSVMLQLAGQLQANQDCRQQ